MSTGGILIDPGAGVEHVPRGGKLQGYWGQRQGREYFSPKRRVTVFEEGSRALRIHREIGSASFKSVVNMLDDYSNLPWIHRYGGRDHRMGTSNFEYSIYLYVRRETPVGSIHGSQDTEVKRERMRNRNGVSRDRV